MLHAFLSSLLLAGCGLTGCGLTLDPLPQRSQGVDSGRDDGGVEGDSAGYLDADMPMSCTVRNEVCNGEDDDCDMRVDEEAAGPLCMGVEVGIGNCVAGSCAVEECSYGHADCDGQFDTGCETDLGTTVDCSDCGETCLTAMVCTPVGVDFECAGECSFPAVTCNGGCVNTEIDPSHCGMCGSSCPDRANSMPRCEGGECQFDCDPGFADCDTNDLNGCETNTRISRVHCGDCGRPCSTGQTCTAGGCAMASCDSWGTWTGCVHNPGQCSGSCGGFMLNCELGRGCTCMSPGGGLFNCPAPFPAGLSSCSICERALNNGCCGF